MSCPFHQATLRAGRPPISAVYDFNDPAASILMAEGEKEKAQVGNPIVPLPTEEYDENAGDEQREDKPKEKPNL